MPNIATALKSEISRVARKELRSETETFRKVMSVYRKEIAALKRRTHALEQQLRGLQKAGVRAGAKGSSTSEEGPSASRRFSAKGLASQRRRLGLSAHDCGLLVGASSQSIYNWEDGKARPRASHLEAIAALRALGKRQATARLEALKNAG
jgi:DNA-binding transcriptional regulator YiaG